MKHKDSEPRTLVLDIETKPILAYVWGLFDQTIGIDFIKEDWNLLSYAAKWVGKPKMFYKDTGGRGVAKVSDDSALLKDLWHLLDEADVVVGQNLRSFDVKKIGARLIQAGYGPYSPIKTVDTMRAAKKHAAFTSNKLAFLSDKLTTTKKSEHRKFPGFSLWLGCMADDPSAWREIARYNKKDVLATEELYLRLRPWMGEHPNVAAFSLRDDVVCPKCSSPRLQARGYAVTQTGRYVRYQCQDCAGWTRGKTNLFTTDKRKSLQVGQ
jgi:hypothetical protein